LWAFSARTIPVIIPASANKPSNPNNKGLQHVFTYLFGGITGGGTTLLS